MTGLTALLPALAATNLGFSTAAFRRRLLARYPAVQAAVTETVVAPASADEAFYDKHLRKRSRCCGSPQSIEAVRRRLQAAPLSRRLAVVLQR